MKFGVYLENNQIPEWQEFYLDYTTLKNLLKPLEKDYKNHLERVARKKSFKRKEEQKEGKERDLLEQLLEPLLDAEDYESVNESMGYSINSYYHHDHDILYLVPNEIVELQLTFQDSILREFKKIQFFIEENLKYYENRLRKITQQLEYIKQNKLRPYKEKVEEAIKSLYKELFLMKDFVELNFKAKIKIMKKFKRVTKFIDKSAKINVEEMLNNFIDKSDSLKNVGKKISDLTEKAENTFYLFFFYKYKTSAIKVLKDHTVHNTFTQSQAFYFGFFVGIMLNLILLCLVIARNFNIDMDSDAEFNSIFPMFRAFMIICIYLWVLGINVWAWNHKHIDYKLVFHFSSYSDVISILRRAAIFSTILLSMIFIYMVIRTQTPIISPFVSFIPLEMTPLICWLGLIIYLFAPFKSVFNYEGRIYTWRLFYESVASIFINTQFRHVWFMDQLISLIGPMRDIEYTMCYYSYYSAPFEARKQLCTKTRGIVLVISIFPHVIRTLQCVRIMIDSKSLYPQILNAFKYIFAMIVTVFSFLLLIYPVFRIFWWILAIFSALYSTYWDIKFDFGFLFLQYNTSSVRERLSYKTLFLYYFSFLTDFILRFVWLVSVSPEIVSTYLNPQFLFLIIYTLEMFRRGMWNFIRVEMQHIQLCKEFKVSIDVELPFKKVNGKFVLRDSNLVDLVRMSKRLEKLKLKKSILDGVITHDVHLPSESFHGHELNDKGEITSRKESYNYDPNYVTTDFRNNFSKYIKDYLGH